MHDLLNKQDTNIYCVSGNTMLLCKTTVIVQQTKLSILHPRNAQHKKHAS